jgi:hypothetical protein
VTTREENMQIANQLKYLPTVLAVGIGLFIIGCGGSGGPTNCLTQAEYQALLASNDISECNGNLPPCNDQTATTVTVNMYICAYYDGSVCGGTDSNGCNTYGHITGSYLHSTACDEENCFIDGQISVQDTGITCNTTNPPPPSIPPCVDTNNSSS